MPEVRTASIWLVSLLACFSLHAASPVHKCVADGSTTYQGDPCPTVLSRQDPNVQALNAQRQKRARAALLAQQGTPAVAAPDSPGQPMPAQALPMAAQRPAAPRATGPQPNAFKCDGRQFCSQMTSCAEAKQFLAHCPTAKMDGDKNGIPCEQQWCGR